ncbi:MAG TPA: amidophosphoribosyltransferase [Saprospiraceae bacterium]|jgi:amidophosphoribosyltransferase|nr:amidophosphoribosyltransferase [Candidatus Parvibacillus calidus]MCC7150071.1 amidophosphoribosyltransferase [Saprospiraceae bacterium]WKZ63034.1 MAG: amidophosphoribosyltransferase [Saprospiraceae bacterium]HRP85046.1 amidophosphoribosyltransferase [Saprospiraceae bacterium]
MSDQIKHECGIALIRLRKPLEFYREKYGTALYGINKLSLLLQKQRNRGQDGAGIATIKLNPEPGTRYISRKRSNSANYLNDLLKSVYKYFNNLPEERLNDPAWLKANRPYMGEVLMGHLRYGTHGLNSIETCHPFMRQNNWMSRTLALAGNFNMTNTDELFQELIELGQFPKEKSDTVTMLEKIGHFLDNEVQNLFDHFKRIGYSNQEITEQMKSSLDVNNVIRKAFRKVDGGYAIMGMIGTGEAFVVRDPHGIRPAYYYMDEDVIAVASERPALQTAFGVRYKNVHEVPPGHTMVIRTNGEVEFQPFTDPAPRKSCSFENIYFSRGNDRKIYLERKRLGEQLAKPIMEMVNYDFDNTVFAFIPNTAETAFYGLVEGLEKELNEVKKKKILDLGASADATSLDQILSTRVRTEKLVVKDAKIRTFISDDSSRGDLMSHVYDVTYGIVKNDRDTLVLLDDSIVRGTTLKQSIINILSKLFPKKIIIVSSAPQIRYPDCYGIDMSVMKSFVAFQAVIEMLEESGREELIEEVYHKCKEQEHLPKEMMTNHVKSLYDVFTDKEISERIARIVRPDNLPYDLEILFQSIDGLHAACSEEVGDWYFSGDYPTPGGTKVVNQAFINYMEKSTERAY